jgi:uncharacterized protein YceK
MKKNLLTICMVIALAILLNACGGESSTTTAPNNSATSASKTETAKVDDSKWTAKDKENAINNCKFGRKNDDPAKVEKLCACYLNNVITRSPNPMEQSKIPMNDVIKFNADCAKEAGL